VALLSTRGLWGPDLPDTPQETWLGPVRPRENWVVDIVQSNIPP